MVWSKTSVHCNLGNTDKAKVWVIYAAERSSSHTSAHYNSTLTVWPQWADLQCVTLWLLGRGGKKTFSWPRSWQQVLWSALETNGSFTVKTSVWSLGGSSHDKWWSTTRRSPQTEQCFCFMAQIANAHLKVVTKDSLLQTLDACVWPCCLCLLMPSLLWPKFWFQAR